jgi:cytoskeletal protein RodZ
MLRKARKDRRRSLEAIASQTKIPVGSLRLLEKDSFHELPGDIFVRGFLKSYCQVLSIGDREVLDAYLKQTGGPADVRSSSIPTVSARSRLPGRLRSLSWVIALVLFLLLGAILLAIIFYPGLRAQASGEGEMRSQDTSGSVETTL